MAAFAAKMEMTGMEALLDQLRNKKPKAAKAGARKGMTKATRLVTKEVKRLTPARTKATAPSNIEPMKLLKKATIGTVKTYPSGVVVGIIGVRRGWRTQIGKRVRGGTLRGGDARHEGKHSRAAVQVGDPIYEDPVKIAHLIEFGTKKSRAFAPLRKGVANKKQEAIDKLAAELRAELEKK